MLFFAFYGWLFPVADLVLAVFYMQGKWIYDMDPFEPLKYEKPLQDFKARVAEEGSKAVFSPLIEKYILNNPHRVTVEMQVCRNA